MRRAAWRAVLGGVALLAVACRAPVPLAAGGPTGDPAGDLAREPAPARSAGTSAASVPGADLAENAPGSAPAAVMQAILTISIRWPQRTVQTIPLSVRSVRIRVLKGERLLAELPEIHRPDPSDTSVTTERIQVDVASGLTVIAEAFDQASIASGSTPIARVEKTGVALVPGYNTVALSLVPTFVLKILEVSPRNGGPGVPVTLDGVFEEWRDFSVFLGGKIGIVDDATDSRVLTRVPEGASSGPWQVWANGVYSDATGSFQVLKSLGVRSTLATASIGELIDFAVEGVDTQGATVSAPALTGWQFVDPGTGGTPSVDVLSATGSFEAIASGSVATVATASFEAVATGSTELRVFSGALLATAAIEVQ